MKRVELFENEKAMNYEQFVDTWIPGYRGFIDSLPAILHETVDKNLLVVGCGTGNEMRCFADDVDEWKATGIDPSPQMISQARAKLAGVDRITLVEGLVSDLDVDKKFGAGTLLLVLHFMRDNGEKLALLRSIAERLEPNAPFVLLDITGDEAHIDANLDVLCNTLSRHNILQTEIAQRRHRIKNELQAVSEERLVTLLTEASFAKPVRFFQNSVYMGWMTHKIG